jgi:hypothetical protein
LLRDGPDGYGRIMRTILALLVALTATAAAGETGTTYCDPMGRETRRSVTSGNVTTYRHHTWARRRAVQAAFDARRRVP